MVIGALDFSKPHVLRDETEFRLAVAEIDALLDARAEPGTEAGDRLEFLTVLVRAYEEGQDPVEASDSTPQEVVQLLLEQRDMTRADLAELMGGRSRVSDFFSGRRELSKNQARALSRLLDVPIGLLLK